MNNTPATPTGKPDDRDRDLWLLLALIRPGDIDAAREMWLSHAPRAFRGLLDGSFAFDAAALSYVAPDGQRRVSGRDLKRLSILLALAIGHELQVLAQSVADGTTPVDLWQREAAAKVKDLFIVQAALAAGGFDKLTDAVLARVTGDAEHGLMFSLDRLRLFAEQIGEHDPKAATVEGIVSRSELYAASSHQNYEDIRRETAKAATDEQGRPLHIFERNILGDPPSQHCAECPELSLQGWVPIGTLPLPGSRQCKMSCYCEIQYSLTGDASDQL